MKTNTTSSPKLHWKSLPTVVLIALTSAIGFVSCNKGSSDKPAVSAPQSAPGSLSELASRSSSPVAQGRHVANADHVSIDGGNNYAHVTYAPAVKMFDHSELQSSLMGVSSDGHGFVFQHASPGIQALKAGDVMMVKGEMAAKVAGVVTDQDQTLVLVDQASLHDVVKSGEIKMDLPVRFHGSGKFARRESPPLASTVLDLLETPVQAQQIPAGTKIAGWTVAKWSMVAADNEADYDLVMVKSEAGFEAWVGIKGWIGNFDISSNLSMPESSSGALSQLAAKASNLSGFVTVEWEIGKSTPGVWATEDRVKLPAGISIPLAPFLGGMPPRKGARGMLIPAGSFTRSSVAQTPGVDFPISHSTVTNPDRLDALATICERTPLEPSCIDRLDEISKFPIQPFMPTHASKPPSDLTITRS